VSRKTITEYLENFVQLGDEVAYTFPRGYRTVRWTYGDVASTAIKFAFELSSRGIGKGDRVLLWGPNCAEWVAAFFGCALQGAVVVPMDRIAAHDFVQRVIQQVQPKLAVSSAELKDAVAPVPVIAMESLSELHPQVERHVGPRVERSDPVEIVFTSGTTAEPKGVVISHGNILANLAVFESEIPKYLKYERLFHPIRFLNLLPLSHVFGQFLGMFIPQLIGGTVLFQETLNPSEVIAVVKRERVSMIVTVPRLLESLKDKFERDAELAGRGERFHRGLELAQRQHFLMRWLRFRRVHRQFGWKFWGFISGGAALDAATDEFWRRLGYVVIQGYGLTETTSLISVQHPFKLAGRSIGKILPGRELKLDPQTGEILVRGESIASGYWQGREIKAVAGDEGWFRTGDLGAIDEHGELVFKGRSKNVIVNPQGLNIHPEDLEAALRAQPEVRDAVVVPLARGGNAEPVAVLLLRNPASDPEPIVRRANQRLAEFQHMRQWFVWRDEDFPRTPTQKPKIAAIQEQVAATLGTVQPGATRTGSLGELITRITGRAAALQPETKLEDLGLNSVDRVELMSALEDRYQLDLDEAQFSAATTIGEIERIVQSGGHVEGLRGEGASSDQTQAERGAKAAPAGSSERDRELAQSGARQFVYPRWAQRWPVTWLRTAIYWIASWPATMIMARPKIVGREHLRGTPPPFLIVSNHITQLDIGFLYAALPPSWRTRLAVAMWGEMLRGMRRPPHNWNPLQRWYEMLRYYLVVAIFNVFPLPQQSGFRQSFAYAGESADRGYSVVVFPEGKRTTTGELNPFRAGVGLLAERLGLPVLPVRIKGLFEYRYSGKLLVTPGAVSVHIGEPVRYPAGADPEEITRDLERRIREL